MSEQDDDGIDSDAEKLGGKLLKDEDRSHLRTHA
jgi:hypothetical protein